MATVSFMANVDPIDPFTDWNSIATLVAKTFRSEDHFQHPYFTKYRTFLVKFLLTSAVIFSIAVLLRHAFNAFLCSILLAQRQREKWLVP